MVLCFDSDAAGAKAAERSLDALLENDFIVRVVELPPGEDPDSLVRRDGKEQFDERVANARDFFDYWIEREIASVDLDFDGRKDSSRAQFGGDGVASARSCPAGRGGQQSIGAPRCCACGFRITSGKARSRTRWFVNSSTTETRAAASPPHDIVMLCLLALRDADARNFLRAQKWREILEQVPDTDILIRILESELRPDDTASLNAFMATLSPEEERLISSWLMQKMPAATETVVEKWWQGTCQSVVRRRSGDGKKPDQSPGLERW